MPGNPRRPGSPPARALPPPPQPPPRTDPPAPSNGGNGTNGEPLGNTIQPEWIYTEGMTAAEALQFVLGDAVTGNNLADGAAAMARIAEWLRLIPALRSVILHLMFNDYVRRGDRRPEHQRNNWAEVARMARLPYATAYKYAHRVECYDTIPGDDDDQQ